MVKSRETKKDKETKAKPAKTVKKKTAKAVVKKSSAKKTTTRKKTEKKPLPEKEIKTQEAPVSEKKEDSRYLEAVGRRKTAVAIVRLFTKEKKDFTINGKKMEDFFPQNHLREICLSCFKKMKCLDKFGVSVKVKGGGINAQAEAIRQGIARALVLFNVDFKKKLRRVGYLTRDSRKRERKKFGLKRARRAPQWRKR